MPPWRCTSVRSTRPTDVASTRRGPRNARPRPGVSRCGLRWLAVLLAVATGAAAQVPTSGAQPLPPGVTVEEHVHHYLLDATEVPALREQLDTRGPRNRFGHPAAGLTRHDFTVRYTSEPRERDCVLRDLTVHVRIDIHLPRWEPDGDAAEALQAQWTALYDALHAHELGHRDNGLWAAAELARRITAVGPARNCTALTLSVDVTRQRVLDALRRREDAFDAASDFGRADLRARQDAAQEAQRTRDADRDRTRAKRLLGP